MFHLNEGRRIVWLFDESWKNSDEESYNRKYYNNGKLAQFHNKQARGPYRLKSFRWLYRRKFVEEGPSSVDQPNYCVCVYSGAEGDIFHKIVSQREDIIIVSLHDIAMSNELNIEEFFTPEKYWQDQEPWKSQFKETKAINKPLGETVSFSEPPIDIKEARRLHAIAIEKLGREESIAGIC